MRVIVIGIIAGVALFGCNSDQAEMLKAMKIQIRSTTQANWENGLPLDDLVAAHKICLQQNLQGCEVIDAQIIDISTAFESCKKDHRTQLCKILVMAINRHPILMILPKSAAIALPSHPFYWSLPTKLLSSQDSKFGFREETWKVWWGFWGARILACFVLLVLLSASRFVFLNRKDEKLLREEKLKNQREMQLEQKRQKQLREKQARIEAERQAQLARDAELAKQEQIAAENLARKIAAEAAAKLAKEQAEASRLLASIFPTSRAKQNQKSIRLMGEEHE